jgi:nitroreductase
MIDVLEAAARQSLRAPSVLNTQPWRWRVTPYALELRADPTRTLQVTDPGRRLSILSCGAALHHARVALTAGGHAVRVDRMPAADDPDLLARIEVTGPTEPDPAAQRQVEATGRRRTDRRAFGARPVDDDVLSDLRSAVEAEGAYLHVVRLDQMPMFAISTAKAAAAERDDPAYRDELAYWTHRPAAAGDGVPASTAVQPAPRRVPVRDHVPHEQAGLTAGGDFDAGASYVILFGTSDEPVAWLRGGEALSALLLTATAAGLSTAPLSDAIEVAWPRRLLRDLLSGVGVPYVAVRLGYVDPTAPALPPAPRREAADVIERVA